jgi:hypothetical protein
MKKMRENKKEMEAFKQIWGLFGQRICNSKMEFFQLEELIG